MHHSLPPDPARCCRVMQLQRCHGSMPIGSMLAISTHQTHQLQMDERSIMSRTTPKKNTPFGHSDTTRVSNICRVTTRATAPLRLQCLSACWDAPSVNTYRSKRSENDIFVSSMYARNMTIAIACRYSGDGTEHSDWPTVHSDSRIGPRSHELSISVGLATACFIEVADHTLDGLCTCVVSL
jgi:hypothetical protein